VQEQEATWVAPVLPFSPTASTGHIWRISDARDIKNQGASGYVDENK
jgi:hypothetical protein